MNENIVVIARDIATEAHKNQTRWGGEPYITHPQAVAKQVESLGWEYEVVAWLHDVLEDTSFTSQDLLQRGIPHSSVRLVQLLTRGDESYLDYILVIKRSRIATAVKLADIEHNLETGTKMSKSARDKYLLARYILGRVPVEVRC